MAVPTVQAVGTPNNGTGNVTYAIPTHQADDILLLVVECAETGGVTAPSGGWAHITNSPRSAGSNVTSVNVMWLRATSGSTTNPTVTDPGNHQVGFVAVIRGAISSGNPWDFTPVASSATGTTTFSATNGTTTVADTLICAVISNNQDTATDQFSSVSMSGVTSFTEREQVFTADGNGGGIALYTGERSATGSPGSCDGTIGTSSAWAGLVFALEPAAGGESHDGTVSASGTPADSATNGQKDAAGTVSAAGVLTTSATNGQKDGAGTVSASGTPGSSATTGRKDASGTVSASGVPASAVVDGTAAEAHSGTITATGTPSSCSLTATTTRSGTASATGLPSSCTVTGGNLAGATYPPGVRSRPGTAGGVRPRPGAEASVRPRASSAARVHSR